MGRLGLREENTMPHRKHATPPPPPAQGTALLIYREAMGEAYEEYGRAIAAHRMDLEQRMATELNPVDVGQWYRAAVQTALGVLEERLLVAQQAYQDMLEAVRDEQPQP